ncbi:ferric reductase-like transmembrane domain-containing protein [Falsibacillus albus]|uniref:Iron reductase n=1 Tax=Falsibacillus albus TaxID=2478915 RepID=A0A3L7K2Y0_9BACI|nr:ferric reductase-like transmembrane domain-containing protein [Falsibacillus albus]RLQ97436.1 iron reductase [Falsibacillus albus]
MNWTWLLIRITGLTAYSLLTISVLAGIFRHIPRKKAGILEFHQVIGQIALLGSAVHVYLLFFDHFQPFSLTEALVPFMSPYHRILSGIGTIALYIFIIVIVTSDFMKAIGRKVWKKTHYLVFPLWLMTWVHGFYLGTDSKTEWSMFLYWGSFLLVLGASLYLGYVTSTKKPANPKPVEKRMQRSQM